MPPHVSKSCSGDTAGKLSWQTILGDFCRGRETCDVTSTSTSTSGSLGICKLYMGVS